MSYPPPLQELIELFEGLSEAERRDSLIDCAQAVGQWQPKPGRPYAVAEVRHDAECSDTVGIFLGLDDRQRVEIAISLGPQVQTLTRALTTLLCRGLNGCTLRELQTVSPDFVPRLIGTDLVRLRSQTVYYVLDRLQQAARQLPAAPQVQAC